MALTDITNPSNWSNPFASYWNGTRYIIGMETYPVLYTLSASQPGVVIRLTLDITEIGAYNFGEYLQMSLTFSYNGCPAGACRLPPALGTGLQMELSCTSPLAAFYYYPVDCRTEITKIEMWDGAAPYFWQNYQGQTETV